MQMMLSSLLFGPPDGLLFEHVGDEQAQEVVRVRGWREPEEVRLARGYAILALNITKIADLTQPIAQLAGGARTQWTREGS